MLNRLKIGSKLGIICFYFTIPLAFAGYFMVDATSFRIDFARRELIGIDYLRPVSGLLADLSEHQSLMRRQLPGAGLDPRVLAELEINIEQHLADLDVVQERLGRRLKVSREEVLQIGKSPSLLPESLRAAWERVRRESTRVTTSDALHAALIADVRALITHVGDTSNLILDPDLDTYYVMDALLLRQPELIDRLWKLSHNVETLLQRQALLSPKERADLAGELALLQFQVEGLKVDVDTAIKNAPSLSRRQQEISDVVQPKVQDFEAAVAEVRQLTGKVLADQVDFPLRELHTKVTEASRLGMDAWGAVLDEESEMLYVRLAAIESERSWRFAVVLVLLVIGVTITALIVRSITLPISKARKVANQLARGELPEKIEVGNATDETGMLLVSINNMLQFLDLRNTIHTLQQSAGRLTDAVSNLHGQSEEQSQQITRQAAALHQTRVIAEEMKQSSQLAAQKAEVVIQVAERAEQVSRAGEALVEKSLQGLTDIRSQVESFASKISELSEWTMQISNITESVKDLADQSNVLALNAAIEAHRSGEHGQGFAVVAREIRNLANESIQATNQVRSILDSISTSIQKAVANTETGRKRIESGLNQVKASGDNLRELSSIVNDSSQSVRQIAAAVGQQNVGIAQIFGAVTDQGKMMDDTVRQIDATQQATLLVKDVAMKVAEVVKRYQI